MFTFSRAPLFLRLLFSRFRLLLLSLVLWLRPRLLPLLRRAHLHLLSLVASDLQLAVSENPLIKKVAFTGSTLTEHKIMESRQSSGLSMVSSMLPHSHDLC
jgi:hypothetical protein